MEIIDIKKYMKLNKITQKQLSQLSGIPISTIEQIFSGKTKRPRLDTINAICKAIGLDYEVPLQPTILNNDRRIIAIDHGAPREEYELSEEDAAIVRELINRLNNKSKY